MRSAMGRVNMSWPIGERRYEDMALSDSLTVTSVGLTLNRNDSLAVGYGASGLGYGATMTISTVGGNGEPPTACARSSSRLRWAVAREVEVSQRQEQRHPRAARRLVTKNHV